MSDAAATFEEQRRYLRGVAYRMLGSVSDAEDVVQEAFLRWHGAARDAVADPRAFLVRVTTRLCLDHLKSARVRRESYVGPWLPEPWPSDADDPHWHAGDDVSVALLMTLERLSPLERAAFLLHDVFDVDYGEIAGTLERSELACRQLVSRAREHVRRERPRFDASPDQQRRVASAFHAALLSGDTAALAGLLAEDAVFYSDGGGKRVAALKPIAGRDKIGRFIQGLQRKYGLPPPAAIELASFNGLPGLLIFDPEGLQTVALEMHGERIAAIYSVRNPDKLQHLLREPVRRV
jgi:RNA polymerase sigma-70 factor, ECF subfamily